MIPHPHLQLDVVTTRTVMPLWQSANNGKIPKDDPLRYYIYSADLNAILREGDKGLNDQKLKDIDEYAYHLFDYNAENFNDRWMYVKGLTVLKYVQRTQFDPQ
jgi:hypothetical protein